MTTNFDFKLFESLVKKGAKQAFNFVRANHPSEKLIGYGLYSDLDAMTICPSVNSESYLNEQVEDDPEYIDCYKWCTSEWAYEFEGSHFFDEAIEMLSFQESEYFREKIYECGVNVLKELDSEGFFDQANTRKDIVLCFEVFDIDDIDLEASWIEALNGSDALESFKKSR
jgi:hypothetical protein